MNKKNEPLFCFSQRFPTESKSTIGVKTKQWKKLLDKIS